eukprot:5558412-Amphidinium_carterae.1
MDLTTMLLEPFLLLVARSALLALCRSCSQWAQSASLRSSMSDHTLPPCPMLRRPLHILTVFKEIDKEGCGSRCTRPSSSEHPVAGLPNHATKEWATLSAV